MRRPLALALPLALAVPVACSPSGSEEARSTRASLTSATCDVIVAGGSAAALTAALTAAREGMRTCLLEPTDWPGGQLTAAGVPAVDYAWQSVPGTNMARDAKLPKNLPADLVQWMSVVGDPGQCSVSENCFQPKDLLSGAILPALSRARGTLTVFTSTVVKSVATAVAGGRTRIRSLTAIRRTPVAGLPWGGYDVNLSKDMADWYAPRDSARYTKETLTFGGDTPVVVIDATELGDVLVTSGAPYLQGVESIDGSLDAADERCGQTATFPFYLRYGASAAADDAPSARPDHPEDYGYEGGYDFAGVWRYRRVLGTTAKPAVGDVSNQNWRLGNDWSHGYLLTSRQDAAAEASDWRGGVDYAQLDAAERQAYGWFRWYRADMPGGEGAKLAVARDVSGTGHGLAKFVYLRDTRRSVGAGGFLLAQRDLEDDGSGKTGARFADRVAIGLYSADLHPMASCRYPDDVYHSWTPRPFFLPLRALTNRDVANLLVAGKTMAQSFRASAATRVHPIELASGVGAGSAATVMVRQGIDDTLTLVPRFAEVQAVASKYTPIDWTLDGVTYPRAGDVLAPPAVPHLYCPPGASADPGLGYCVDDANAYGPFTRAMRDACVKYGGGPACDATRDFVIEGHHVAVVRWSRAFALALRGTAACMIGAQRDARLPVCVEDAASSASGVKEAYGPFDSAVVTRCIGGGGGDACYTNRWSYAFFASLAAR